MKVQELIDSRMILKSYEDKIWKRVFEKAKAEKINTKFYRFRENDYIIDKNFIEFEIHDGTNPEYRDSQVVILTYREIEMSDEEFHDHLHNNEQQRKEREEKEKALSELAARAVRRQQYEKLKLEFEPNK